MPEFQGVGRRKITETVEELVSSTVVNGEKIEIIHVDLMCHEAMG